VPITLKLPGGQSVTVPDDTTPEEMDRIANESAPPPKTGQVRAKEPGLATIGDQLRAKGRVAAPAVGGMVGGLVGGIPGAIVGGGAGQGIGTLIDKGGEIPGAVADVTRNLFREPVATMRGLSEGVVEGATNMGTAAGLEGASQFVGGKVAEAGGVMAKWLMNRATTRVSEKLMREFPDLADTLIDEALTVSKGGYEKALGLLKAAKAKATATLQAADASGATIPVQMSADVAESLKTALLEDVIRARGLQASPGAVTSARNRLPPQLRALFQQIDQAATSGGALDLVPSHADLLKSRLQKESKRLYGMRGAPNGPTALGMDATETAELAAQINAAIDKVATGYKAANAEARPLIGATRGIKQAIRPNGNLYQAMVRPAVGGALGAAGGGQSEVPGGSVVGALAGAAMTSPAGMSREAILLASPAMQEMLKQLPRGTAMALTQLLRERSGAQGPAPRSQE
jgi:hypothetical protein